MKKGYLYILLATFLFSTMEIALKLTAGNFNAVQLTFLRFLIGSLILLPPALKQLKRKRLSLRAGDFAFFALTGLICVDISMILYQMAVLYAPASTVAVLFSCNSVFLILFAFFMLGEKIRLNTAVCIVLSLLGMAVMINPFHFAGGAAGTVLSLAAAVAFALYSAIGRFRSARYGGVVMTCFSFLFGCAEMLALISLTHLRPVSLFLRNAGLAQFADVPVFSGISIPSLPGLAYVGIFVTGCGFAFYFLAIETAGASKAALVFFCKPVLAPLFSLAVLGEPITLQMVAGIVLIVVGSFITFLPETALHRHAVPAKTAIQRPPDD
ncbi:DMT family transporter [Caproiciproducens sp. NJN-50]|uniref:DMT family transporter n=1 Tax=Acutalibacteraceae TaxID=3082771 RepID=UPI000FFE30A4|nr:MULTISPECIES: DMT family transporter [Acutalibacteraceae]QAT50197.1 DMT family transporter [Caproiciproducens sp. NJN-50]